MNQSREPFAYERLAADITSLIRSGTLRPGDRVPSVRRMSTQRGLSIPTVLHAYNMLKMRRVIESRPRSGYYVMNASRPELPARHGINVLPLPETVSTGDLIVRTLDIMGDPALVPLGTALPEPALLPGATLARLLARAVRHEASRAASQVTTTGTVELRREIARRALEAGAAVTADDVVTTCGCTEAVFLSLRAITQPGDTVAVESPTYFGTLQALEVLGLKALEIPVDPTSGMSIEVLSASLERAGVAAVVITPSVHNPLGCVMPDARKRELVELLARHGVPAIEDDTYGELQFAPARPRSLRAFDHAGNVLTCGSFSKTLAPGYRLGWVIPGRFKEKVLHLKVATTAGSPVPAQLAVADFLKSGGYSRHLRRLRRTFRSSTERLSYEIAQRFPQGTRISQPAGGFLLWVELPEGIDTLQLQREALQRGLCIAPGPAFSASGAFGNHLRINAGYRWSARFAEALDVVAEMIKSVSCEDRLIAIDRSC